MPIPILPRALFKIRGADSLGRALMFFLVLAIVLLLGWLLYTLKFIFLPMLLAFFITSFLNPPVEWLQRRGLPRPLGIIITLGLSLLLSWAAVNFIASSMAAFHQGFPKYEQRIQEIASQAQEFTDGFHFLSPDNIQEFFSRVSLSELIGSTFNSFFTGVAYVALTFLFVLYFLPSFPDLPEKIRRAYPGPKGARLHEALNKIGRQAQSYIWAKTLTSLVTGLSVAVSCLFFQVDFIVTWGAFSVLLNFIPTIGAIAAIVPPILVCGIQHDLTAALWLGLTLAAVMVGIGNFLEPRVLGRSVNLSPTAALVALFFWGWLWGGIGMIIAVPATAMIKFTCDHIESLSPVGVMLGH